MYQRWIALPKFVVDQKRKKVLPAWVVDEMKHRWKGNPLQTLLIWERFRMTHCAETDGSKQSLELWMEHTRRKFQTRGG